jgi:hypothetical protein
VAQGTVCLRRMEHAHAHRDRPSPPRLTGLRTLSQTQIGGTSGGDEK